jgi:hypothetical protein
MEHQQPSRHNDSTSHKTSFLLYAAQEALKSGNSPTISSPNWAAEPRAMQRPTVA